MVSGRESTKKETECKRKAKTQLQGGKKTISPQKKQTGKKEVQNPGVPQRFEKKRKKGKGIKEKKKVVKVTVKVFPECCCKGGPCRQRQKLPATKKGPDERGDEKNTVKGFTTK